MKTTTKIVILSHHSPEGTTGLRRAPVAAMRMPTMPDESLISDDPGTILESYVSVPRALPPAAAAKSISSPSPAEEVLYRSVYRWTAPRILICDDGSLDDGETFYVRSDKAVIGRAKGDIVISHDVAMSGSHAEIARRDSGGKHSWKLKDLGSSNGTLVRARSVTLRPGMVLQLGTKRYRFELPQAVAPGADGVGEPKTTLLADMKNTPADMLPALVESAPASGVAAARYAFRSTRITIGRPRCGNDIEVEDLCLAGTHAVVTRDVSGVWQIEAKPSLNGVWVKVDAVTLSDNCLFQCGEQRFRFFL